MGGLDDESDEEPGNALQYKFILLGDGTVGKTSLALRFTDDSFNKRRERAGLTVLTVAPPGRGFLQEGPFC